MRQVKSMALMGFLATLVLTSASVLAIEVDVKVDKHIVAPGDTITVSGTVTSDDGAPGTFEYRAAAIVAKQRNGGERVIICDSGKQTTDSTGSVSFECKIPTLTELEELGVENAATRSVIPIKGGISVLDPETNESEREHGKALIVNTDKIKEKLEGSLDRLDSFIENAQNLQARCDNITARAEEAGAERLIERCGEFQEKVQERIDHALAAQARINSVLANLTSGSIDFDDLKGSLLNFRDGARDFRVEVKDLRGFVEGARADLEKRVSKELVERAKQRAEEIREQMKTDRERIKNLHDELKDERREIKEDILRIRDRIRSGDLERRHMINRSMDSDDSDSVEPEDEKEEDEPENEGENETESSGSSGSG